MTCLHRTAANALAGIALLLSMTAHAQLSLPASLSISPSAASGGGSVRIGASRLPDVHYEVTLANGRETIRLVDIPAGSGEFGRYVELPVLAAGIYRVELRVDGNLSCW